MTAAPSREKCPGWGGPHLMTRAMELWRCSMCGLTVRPTNTSPCDR